MVSLLRSIPIPVLIWAVTSGELSAQMVPLQGSFTYVAEESDDVEQAIQAATGRMNFALRGIARGRLRRTNQPYQRLTIAHTTAEVTIITDDRAPITSPSSGAAVQWTREDGEVLQVSSRWEHGRLRQSFMADDGQRDNVFRLSPDGRTLSMEVTVRSGRLSQPLSYTLVYRRSS